jgi:hypothetical protein
MVRAWDDYSYLCWDLVGTDPDNTFIRSSFLWIIPPVTVWHLWSLPASEMVKESFHEADSINADSRMGGMRDLWFNENLVSHIHKVPAMKEGKGMWTSPYWIHPTISPRPTEILAHKVPLLKLLNPFLCHSVMLLCIMSYRLRLGVHC